MLPIELEEIEDALAALGSVRDVFMLAPSDQAATSRMAERLACLRDLASGNGNAGMTAPYTTDRERGQRRPSAIVNAQCSNSLTINSII